MQGNQGVAGIVNQNPGTAGNLKLELINLQGTYQDQQPEFIFDEQGGVIGRGSDCDWILRCTRRLISRHHAIISYIDGQYYIQDASSNGITLNDSSEPLPQGMCTPLQQGDIFFVGDLSIRASLISEDELSGGQHGTPHFIESTVIEAQDNHRHAVSEMPAVRLAEVVQHGQDRIPRQTAELGSPEDHFEPPSAIIPDNWDLDLSAQSRTPADAIEKPAASPFKAHHSLFDALLSGMGIPGMATSHTLSPDAMEALGRCLRISIEGLSKLHEGHNDIESSLLHEKLSIDQSTPVESISRLAPFVDQLLKSDKQSADDLLSQLRENYADLVGQQAAVIDCLGKVGGIVAEQFDPERIENAFKRYQAQQAKSRRWYHLFFRSGIRKRYHAFFEVYFKLRKRETERALKCVFGQRFLVFYAGRLRGK